MNILTYVFGEPTFPTVSPKCKLKGQFVDLSTIPLIKRFLVTHKNDVTPEGGYYCDGRKLLTNSVLSSLMLSDYARIFQELLRVMSNARFDFRVVMPRRLDEFVATVTSTEPHVVEFGQVTVVSKTSTLFQNELSKFGEWELGIFSEFEAVFPEYVYKTDARTCNAITESRLIAGVHLLVSSPLMLSTIMGVNSLRIEPVRSDSSKRLYIHYSFIDINNNLWKLKVPGKMRRHEQVSDIIDQIEYNGMGHSDMPPGMAEAALPWGLFCVN